MSLPPSPTFSVIYSEVIHWRLNLFFKSLLAKQESPSFLNLQDCKKALASSSAMESIGYEGSHCSTYSVVTEAFLQVKKLIGTQRLPGQMVEHVAQWEFE